MDTRVVLLGIIVENTAAVEELNAILHNYGSYIIGRMGLPYRGVTAKALYAGKQA